MVKKIVEEDYEKIPNLYNKEIESLIDKMLQKQPEKRPSIKEILKMQIFENSVKKY